LNSVESRIRGRPGGMEGIPSSKTANVAKKVARNQIL
jgi:hypothetical protein